MKRKLIAPHSLHSIITLALAAPFLLWTPGSSQAAEGSAEYIRFVPQGSDAGRLESAIATFEKSGGFQVHLVAAIHIADRGYYEKLQSLFESYEALLYEMVKPAGAEPRPGERGSSLIGMFQRGLKDVLGLEFQLDVIDYRKPNFIHADMDAATFDRLQRERGENLFSLMLRVIAEDLKRQAEGDTSGQITAVDLLTVFLSRDRARALKLLLGRQFQDIEARVAGFEGENGSVILTERNKVAFEVLKKTLEGGKKQIGIFYGGAHMPDLEKRLTEELGFKKKGIRWLVAWDMSKEGERPAPRKPSPEKRPRRF